MDSPNPDSQQSQSPAPQPQGKQPFLQWYFSLFSKNAQRANIFTYKPSSPLFNAVRIWVIVLVAIIIALAVFSLVRLTIAINTDASYGTNKGAAIFALMLISFPFMLSISSVLAIIPFIMSLFAGKQLHWKIQPFERFIVFFLGLLAFLGLFFLPALPGLFGLS